MVVASYNGARTLKACLDSLAKLNYPNFEVILVDDGSTDATPQIAVYALSQRALNPSPDQCGPFHGPQYRHCGGGGRDCPPSRTRIAGRTPTGFITWWAICWMTISRALAAIILLPPEDSSIAAAVLVSPGGPAHVMLTDRQAWNTSPVATWRSINGRWTKSMASIRSSKKPAMMWISAGACSNAGAK